MRTKDDVGRRGEEIALAHVVGRGWTVLATNWRCGREGELDIVALDGDVLVVVEVKTRSGTGFGHPSEGVTDKKLARLRRLAGRWGAVHREAVDQACERDGVDLPRRWSAVRIDVVAVTLPAGAAPVLEHLEAVAR
ncbi:YraN family protein [Myceligenerans cantabricum]